MIKNITTKHGTQEAQSIYLVAEVNTTSSLPSGKLQVGHRKTITPFLMIQVEMNCDNTLYTET